MAWDTKEALATLTRAMEFEAEGRTFYLRAAERTLDRRGKRMFESLAEDESKHYIKLQQVREELATTGAWVGIEGGISDAAAGLGLPPIFDTKVLNQRVRPSDSDVEALELAMKAERISLDAYAAGRDSADDPNARALFAQLAEEERQHFGLLESTLTYLTYTGSFWDAAEDGPLEQYP